LVASLPKFYSCLFQTLSECNTSTPPPLFWVRWQGWPILPPLHSRDETISLKIVYEKFCDFRFTEFYEVRPQ
jgi:hypothetical protein